MTFSQLIKYGNSLVSLLKKSARRVLSPAVNISLRLSGVVNNNHASVFFVASIPVLVYLPYLISGDKMGNLPGDFDYFLQAYEAIRKSILEHGQFPWWNPWVGGGVPLYANPQVGVFSIPTLLSLIFGTVYGLKLSVLTFILMGYFGAYLLFRKSLMASRAISILAACAWVLNGFFYARFPHHFSFTYYLLFPLLLFLQLNLNKKGKWWVAYAGVVSLCVLGAVHYALLHMFFILGFVLAGQVLYHLYNSRNKGLKSPDLRRLASNLLKAGGVVVLLCGHRIIYTYQYVSQYPRELKDVANEFIVAAKGLAIPNVGSNFFIPEWFKGDLQCGAGEYAASIGLGLILLTLLLVMIGLWKFLKSLLRDGEIKVVYSSRIIAAILLLIGAFFLMAKGDFDSYSPYALLQNLPAFGGMRVPSRWLLWAAFSIIVLATYVTTTRNRRTFLGAAARLALLLAVVELSLSGVGQDRQAFVRSPELSMQSSFVQQDGYVPKSLADRQEVKEHMRKEGVFEYEATASNIGVLRGYEPLHETRFDTQGRCGLDKGCELISTNNARMTSWSPNRIELERTGQGTIELNIVPSQYWTVNGARPHSLARLMERGRLIIDNPSQVIILEIKPKSVVELAKGKLKR